MAAAVQPALRTCPRCGATDTQDLIVEAGYHCRRCAFELAHLEVGASGGIRRVVGWLRAPGDVVGDRYRVTTVLGKGGYAATYLVADTRLEGKRRALKEIPEHLYDEQETQLLSRLHHEGIPDITDRFESEGMVYLVLEYGGTQTLESERRRCGGRVPLERVASWMSQLCDVLTYLHAQTPPIVHRDLKPANILLDERQRVMLIDFGIAKESLAMESTRTMARAATHGFSPPEQVLGTGTDARSDVYALGATMYALLTGTAPPPAHERLTGAEVTPPRRVHPGIPPELERLILWCLDLRPERRPQSVDQLRTAFVRGRWSGELAWWEPSDDDRTVPVAPEHVADLAPRHTVSDPTTTRVPPEPGPPAARWTFPPWRGLVATAAALLGLATVTAVVQPWRAVIRRPGSRAALPDVDRTATSTSLPPPVAVPPSAVLPPAAAAPPSTPVATPPTTLPETLDARILRLLADNEFAGVTVAIESDRIRLGNLRDETTAQRAREPVASLAGIDRPVDTDVLPPPKPPRSPLTAPETPRPPRRRVVERPPQQAPRTPQPPPQRRRTSRPSPPPEWVLIPQPARRTD